MKMYASVTVEKNTVTFRNLTKVMSCAEQVHTVYVTDGAKPRQIRLEAAAQIAKAYSKDIYDIFSGRMTRVN